MRRTPTLPLRLVMTLGGLAVLPGAAHASLFSGETLDAVANGAAWVVLIIVPVIGIAVFWLVHILPEKIAEKRNHPQTAAIQTLCLLSLFFGGLLWPLAWLWAYTKPVFYRMAYGTDQGEHGPPKKGEPLDDVVTKHGEETDVKALRAQIADLERKLARAEAEGERA